MAQGVPRQAPQAAAGHVLQHSLNDLYETTGSCSVQWSPALVVPSVDVAPTLHQKLHHLRIFVNASLPDTGDTMETMFRAQVTVPVQQQKEVFWLK